MKHLLKITGFNVAVFKKGTLEQRRLLPGRDGQLAYIGYERMYGRIAYSLYFAISGNIYAINARTEYVAYGIYTV